MKLTTLVIDDSGVMRKMVMKSLTETKLAEFDFIEAEDGMIALEKMKAHEVDICFVDWNMPNMTGIDFVKEVRKDQRANSVDPIPLVMVTSEKTMGKLQEALDDAGADGFISKPFTVPELQSKLKKHTDRAQLMRLRKERNKQPAAPAPAAAASGGGWMGKMFS